LAGCFENKQNQGSGTPNQRGITLSDSLAHSGSVGLNFLSNIVFLGIDLDRKRKKEIKFLAILSDLNIN
jgi:hypothetical protein